MYYLAGAPYGSSSMAQPTTSPGWIRKLTFPPLLPCVYVYMHVCIYMSTCLCIYVLVCV